MEKTKIGVFGLTLVVARRNGHLAAGRIRDTEMREQKCRAKLACPVYCGCAAAFGYTHGAAHCLKKRTREIFRENPNC